MSKTTRAYVQNHKGNPGPGKAWREVHPARYDYDPEAESIGLQAAEALGVEPQRMLKTLMAEVDGKPVCAVVPADAEVSMKKLASAFGAKTRR